MSATGGAVLPIVGVMGSGREPHEELADPLGRWLASLPVHLLTGGGGGVMASVSRAFSAVPGRTGRVIGVLPGVGDHGGTPRPPRGYPNPWVEIAIRTPLPESGVDGVGPSSRNPINVLTSDVVVALPGSHGTASEVALALLYGRPLIVHADGLGAIPGLTAGVRVEPDFSRVQEFVRSVVG